MEKRHSKDFLTSLTPAQALDFLIEGNKRFVDNKLNGHDHPDTIKLTKDGQFPFAVVLSCMDSRTSVELIFDQGIGEVFSIRVAGNIVNGDIIGSIEYAVAHVGSKLVVILGHTSCGAIKGAHSAGAGNDNLTTLLNRIVPSINKAMLSDKTFKFSDKVAYANVENSMEELLKQSPIVKEKFEKGEIGLAGGVYNIENGEVDFFKTLTR